MPLNEWKIRETVFVPKGQTPGWWKSVENSKYVWSDFCFAFLKNKKQQSLLFPWFPVKTCGNDALVYDWRQFKITVVFTYVFVICNVIEPGALWADFNICLIPQKNGIDFIIPKGLCITAGGFNHRKNRYKPMSPERTTLYLRFRILFVDNDLFCLELWLSWLSDGLWFRPCFLFWSWF